MYQQWLAERCRTIDTDDGFAGIESRLLECIAEAFGLELPIPESVHEVDRRILVNERHRFMEEGLHWPQLDGVQAIEQWNLPRHFDGLWPHRAKWRFVNRYSELTEASAAV
jgi:hypothetical protein